MLLLAANAFEKVAQVPMQTWLYIGLGILAIVGVVIGFRVLAQVNKLVLFGVLFFGGFIVFVNWVYERNEPAFLSPIIDKLALFLPTKGEYEKVQSKPLPTDSGAGKKSGPSSAPQPATTPAPKK